MEMLSHWYRAAKQFPISTAAAAFAVIAITLGVLVAYPRTYRARAQVLLRVGHENMTVDPTAEAAGQMVQMQLTRDNDIQNALQVMLSRALLGEVVDQIGTQAVLEGLPVDGVPIQRGASGIVSRAISAVRGYVAAIDPVSDRERAIRELSKHLDVSSEIDASVVTAEYRAKTPESAQAILDVWLDAYLSKHAELTRTSGSHEFFQEQELSLRANLDETYQLLRDAKTSNGLVTVEGQQKLLEGQLAAVRTAMIEAETKLAGSKARTESLRKTLSETADRTVMDEVSGIANEARDSMRGRLFELEVLEREYAAKYKPDHPRLVTIRNQLDEAQQIVEEQTEDRAEVTSGINPIYQQLQQELLLETASEISHEKQLESLVARQDSLRAEIASLNQTEEQITALDRQAEILESRYTHHSERLEQARIDEALREKRITSVSVIQSASLEERPVTPNKPMTAALGFLALLAAVLGLPLVLAPDLPPETLAAQSEPPVDPSRSLKDEQDALLHPMFFDEGDADESIVGESLVKETTIETRRVAR